MEGWICPRCGRANAPFNMTCDCNGKSDISYSDRTYPLYTKPKMNFDKIAIAPSPCIDQECADYDYLKKIMDTPISVLPKEESQIIVDAKPQFDYNDVIAPLRQRIEALKHTTPGPDASTEARREAYNLAIDDVLELIDGESEKKIVIEITAPCNHQCEMCVKNCKEKKDNE